MLYPAGECVGDACTILHSGNNAVYWQFHICTLICTHDHYRSTFTFEKATSWQLFPNISFRSNLQKSMRMLLIVFSFNPPLCRNKIQFARAVISSCCESKLWSIVHHTLQKLFCFYLTPMSISYTSVTGLRMSVHSEPSSWDRLKEISVALARRRKCFIELAWSETGDHPKSLRNKSLYIFIIDPKRLYLTLFTL